MIGARAAACCWCAMRSPDECRRVAACVPGWRKKGPTASHCADHPPREGGGGPARGPVDTHAVVSSWRKVRRWPVLISGSRVRACFHSSRLPGLGGLSPLVRAHAPRISLRIHHQEKERITRLAHRQHRWSCRQPLGWLLPASRCSFSVPRSFLMAQPHAGHQARPLAPGW